MTRLNPAIGRRVLKSLGVSATTKYGNTPVTVDGLFYASKAEARRAQELSLLERAGEIRNLRRQVRYELHAPGTKSKPVGERVGFYIADFAYEDCKTGKVVVEDVKSETTAGLALFKWKVRHMKAEWEIDVQVVLM